ncbi:thiamine-phosphate kinase [Helicobacter mesocricetorum]|uniref:thiamine-phosphate kinase n=1 Tax=Helicobacter mesocricetorum TaxID=87012 RepID=UPI000CF07352|nr:thiamine-phosphate kinase [Helicobacter mesocricetorum]
MQDREKQFIQTLKKESATYGIGDDGVVLGDFVIATDAFFEGIHFKREWGSLEILIEKCFLVNLSDIYAMNAIPKYLLLTLCIPKDMKSTKDIARIFSAMALKYGIKIIGGDTIIGEKLHFSLTLLGQKRKKVLYRYGIKPKDYLAYLSPKSVLKSSKKQAFGKNISYLKRALLFGTYPKDSRFAMPLLYPKMILALNAIARAGMDISDGIFIELSRLAKINKIGFKFLLQQSNWFYSPEEYQMLYAFSPRKLSKAKRLANQYRYELIVFARAKRGSYQLIKKNWHG